MKLAQEVLKLCGSKITLHESKITLNLKTVGIKNMMDYSDLIDTMREKNIDWEQPKPGFLRIDKKDISKLKDYLMNID